MTNRNNNIHFLFSEVKLVLFLPALLRKFSFSCLIPIFALFLLATQAQAQTVYGYSMVPPNPLPGQAFQLAVTYCNTAYGTGQTTLWEVLLNTAPTISACAAANQEYLVDMDGTNLDEKNPSGTGSIGLATTPADDGNGACTITTKVFNLTLPQQANYGGTYYVNVGISLNYMGCGSAPGTLISIPLTITPPPATVLSLNKDAEGKSASTGDLVLFNIDYNFVNSPAGGVITDTVPPGVTFVQMGPPGDGPVNTVGNLSWTVPGSADDSTGRSVVFGKGNSCQRHYQ